MGVAEDRLQIVVTDPGHRTGAEPHDQRIAEHIIGGDADRQLPDGQRRPQRRFDALQEMRVDQPCRHQPARRAEQQQQPAPPAGTGGKGNQPDGQQHRQDDCALLVDQHHQGEADKQQQDGCDLLPGEGAARKVEQKDGAEEHRHENPIAAFGLEQEQLRFRRIGFVEIGRDNHPQHRHQDEGRSPQPQDRPDHRLRPRAEQQKQPERREIIQKRQALGGGGQGIDKAGAEIDHRHQRRQPQHIGQETPVKHLQRK